MSHSYARQLAERGIGEALSRHDRQPLELSKTLALVDEAVGVLFAHDQWLRTPAPKASQEEYGQRTRVAAEALFDLLRVCLGADEPDPRDELILALYKDRMEVETSYRSRTDEAPFPGEHGCPTVDVFNALYELLEDPGRNLEFKKVVAEATERRNQAGMSSNTHHRESSGGATSVDPRLRLEGASNVGPSRGRPDTSASQQKPSPGADEALMTSNEFPVSDSEKKVAEEGSRRNNDSDLVVTSSKSPRESAPEHPVSLEAALDAFVTQKGLVLGALECRSWNCVRVVFGRGFEFFSIDASVEPIQSNYSDTEALERALYNAATKMIDEKVGQLGWG